MDKLIHFYSIYSTYINIAVGAAVFLLFFALRKTISSLLLNILGKIIFAKKDELKGSLKESLSKPLSVFFVLLGAYIGVFINYRRPFVTDTFKIFSILIIFWGVLCYISHNLQLFFNSKSNNVSANSVAAKFVLNILRVIIICIAVVMVLSELGYNINGLLTGLGVGGLAVSLAAQDSLKNLISGFVIIFDKPFDTGDLIETPEFSGFVEDITMRSTRIRKLDDSVIVVPNSALADSNITNYAKLTKRLVDFKIGIVYSAETDTIKKCEEEIRAFLRNQESVHSGSIRVCFAEFDDSSLNLQIRCYVNITDIEVYSAFVEELNYEIKTIIENNGLEFAYPSRSIFIEKK